MPGMGLPKTSDTPRSRNDAYAPIIDMRFAIGAVTSTQPTRGNIIITPFVVPTSGKMYTRLSALMNTAAGTVRFGIYADVGRSPANASKLLDTGNITVATPTRATVAWTPAAGMYWLAMTYSTTAAAYVGGYSNQALATFSFGSVSYRAGSLASNTISLPDPFPASISWSGGNARPIYAWLTG